MRRTDREVKNFDQMIGIMESCDCCRLGLVSSEGAYIVPLNFGYEREGEKLTLYFHGASQGKKIDLIRAQESAAFEMDTRHELVEGDTACAYSYRYQSIMGRGRIRLAESDEEKFHGLKIIMAHYSRKSEPEFREEMVKRTAVIRLEVDSWSCKEH